MCIRDRDIIYEFKETYETGLQGEQLIKLHYQTQNREDGKGIYIVRPSKKWEQEQGADFFVVNNELGTRYFEVKTDTQATQTNNVALEIQIVHPDKKTIGCAMKTFPDFLFYWIYPTNRVLFWNPTELNPYIIDWTYDNKYKIVETENKKFFSRSMLVPIEDMLATSVVKELSVSMELVDKVVAGV